MTREESLFAEALTKTSAATRAAYLDEACDGDVDLRKGVEALLLAHEGAAGILECPIVDLDVTSDSALPNHGVGSTVGPYKLLEQIGGGGMGVVYMAEQTHPVRRKVALKIIKPGMDSHQVIARFEAERQALTMMEHPNIAKVLDAGTTDIGRPYFVMELVKGIPITDYCDQARLATRQRLELFVQVCNAVQHAHQKGIIHRDLKPTNVLVTLLDDKPVPKVIDFGIAKATGQVLTERTLFTNYAQMLGTPLYMSPEQAQISGTDVDTRSDVYSLGVLLYELLTGTTPFDKQRMREAAYDEMRRIIREEDPPKPSTRISTMGEMVRVVSVGRHTDPKRLGALVRGELDWIVMKALEKDRAHRYETASGFAKDVQRYLGDEPVQACPPSPLYRFRKFARRNKAIFAAGVGIVLILLLGLVGLSVSNILITREKHQKELALKDKQAALERADSSASQAREQAALAKANEHVAAAQELLARRRFYAGQMNLAMAAWERGEPARTLDLLEEQRPTADQDDLRGFEWFYLWHLTHRGLRARFNHGEETVYCVRFAPDGKTMFSLSAGLVRIWDVATGDPKAAFQTNGWRFTISPDGKRLATWNHEGAVKIWQVEGGKQLAAFDDAWACTFSPDGQAIALTFKSGVEFWNAIATERRSFLPRRGPENARQDDMFVFTPDGSAAIIQEGDNLVRIYRLDGDTWREGGDITGHGWPSATAVSRDSRWFALGGDRLTVYSTETGAAVTTLVGHSGVVRWLSFSPDGGSLVTASDDRTVRIWDRETGQQRRVFAHPGPVFWVDYSPDGKTLAASGPYGMLRVWDLEARELPTVLTPGGGCVAISGDGATVAIALPSKTDLRDLATGETKLSLEGNSIGVALTSDGRHAATISVREVRLWELGAPQQPEVLSGHSDKLVTLAFAPDGRTLATAGFDRTVRLWDVAARQTRLTIDVGVPVSAVAFSPNGRVIATGTLFERVKLWDAASGRRLLTLQGNDREGSGPWTWSVAFSPDGNLLAATSQTGLVRLWNTSTGKLHAALQGHTANVLSVDFSPDGNTVATASQDHTVRLWDAATGQEKSTLHGHTALVRSVAFAPNGEFLISGGYDETARVWHAPRRAGATTRRSDSEPD